ncbi:MAG TPA: hypothetical protein VIK53_10320 [Verrucomicrobiae bacterium]
MPNPRHNRHQINDTSFARHSEQGLNFIIRVSAPGTDFLAACFRLLHHGQRIGDNSPLLGHPIQKPFCACQVFIQRLGGFLVFGPPLHKRVGGDIF